jgi:hypothetical protein
MALVIKDRIKETSTTTGTGTLTLAGASTGFKAFSEIGSGNTTYYAISDGTDWEVGLGTVGSGTLSRDTILASSNAGSAVSWNSDVKDVFCTYPADKAVYLDASGNFNISGGDITFGDNDKAIFGAGSDLQIYHDGTHSYVQDAGTGNLVLKSSDTVIQSNTAETMAVFNGNGSVDLYYNNSKKLATTNTGVDITGTLTSDGLTVDGDVTLGNGATLNIDDQDSIVFGTYSGGSTGTLLQGGTSTDYSIRVAGRLRQNISTGGDISFYEDTGTTPKFFWDASAESLGIGTSSPSAALHISSPSNARGLKLQNSSSISASQITFLSDDGTEDSYIRNQASNSGQDILSLGTGGAERMRIDSNGNVGIGTTPSGYLTSGYVLRLNSSSTQTYLAFNNSTYTTQVTGGFVIGMDNASANIIQRENLPIKVYTNDTERMRIDSSGNVGIGTSSPSKKLHSVVSSSGSLETALALQNANAVDGTETALDFSSNTSFVATSRISSARDGSGLHSLRFSTYNLGLSERMRIDSSGRVGIGTSSPSVDLEVVDTFRVSRSGSPTTYLELFGGSSSNDPHLNVPSGFGMPFKIGGTERMRITSSGNVGIGTSSPLAMLHISNSADVTQLRLTRTVSGSSIMRIESSGFLNIKNVSGAGITFGTNNVNDRMVINTDGSVTIAGALSKGSGSFRIDHPLKPETHQLVHSFIEGPQADLIYRGKVELVAGSAMVNIDTVAGMTEGTFAALNREIQCFTSNESGWTAVRGSVSGNILTIEAQDNTCTDTISWLVVGERQDQHMYDTEWTDENGKVIVEPLKQTESN